MPIRRRTRGRSAQGPGRGGRALRGLSLFLLGALAGGVGTYAGCRDTLHGGAADRAAVAPHGLAADRTAAERRASAAGRPRRGPAAASSASPLLPSSPNLPNPPSTGAPEPAQAPAGGTAPPGAGGQAGAGPVRLALVIDDLGRSLKDLESLRRLGVPITYAVLPFESETGAVVADLRQHHEEILCHLPMEPRSGGNPGPGALRAGMSPLQLRQTTVAALEAVPGAVGVNNHMGSALSADAASMTTILGVIGARGLFFLDSRTSAQSVGYRVATSLGVPAAERQVFLDDDPRPEAVAEQFQRLLELARDRGGAIAIGHPHAATLAALAEAVPRAQAGGYRFVQVSDLLTRPTVQPLPPAPGR